jgi:hypothetical protein
LVLLNRDRDCLLVLLNRERDCRPVWLNRERDCRRRLRARGKRWRREGRYDRPDGRRTSGWRPIESRSQLRDLLGVREQVLHLFERRSRLVRGCRVERGFRAQQQPVDAPLAHPHLKALPLLGGCMRGAVSGRDGGCHRLVAMQETIL